MELADVRNNPGRDGVHTVATGGSRQLAVFTLSLVGAALLAGCDSLPHPATTSSAAITPSSTAATTKPTSTAPPQPADSTSSTSTTAEPVTISLICGSIDRNVDYTSFPVLLDEKGVPDYRSLWRKKLSCDDGMAPHVEINAVEPTTKLQDAVLAAAKKAGYWGASDDETTPGEALYSVYQGCGSNDPTDHYATATDYSEEQILELKAWMVLCPDHPQAKKWRKSIVASGELLIAEKNGSVVYDGTHDVPKQMQRGTFVVEDVEDCYWETRNSTGQIISNDFVLAAPRVVATVGKSAVVFTARGCGKWVRQ